MTEPICNCGARCWAHPESTDEPERGGPCWGSMHVTEDYPGVYTHFCDGHGHPEDNLPYTPNQEQKP